MQGDFLLATAFNPELLTNPKCQLRGRASGKRLRIKVRFQPEVRRHVSLAASHGLAGDPVLTQSLFFALYFLPHRCTTSSSAFPAFDTTAVVNAITEK